MAGAIAVSTSETALGGAVDPVVAPVEVLALLSAVFEVEAVSDVQAATTMSAATAAVCTRGKEIDRMVGVSVGKWSGVERPADSGLLEQPKDSMALIDNANWWPVRPLRNLELERNPGQNRYFLRRASRSRLICRRLSRAAGVTVLSVVASSSARDAARNAAVLSLESSSASA